MEKAVVGTPAPPTMEAEVARLEKLICKVWRKTSLDYKYVDAHGVLADVGRMIDKEFQRIQNRDNPYRQTAKVTP